MQPQVSKALMQMGFQLPAAYLPANAVQRHWAVCLMLLQPDVWMLGCSNLDWPFSEALMAGQVMDGIPVQVCLKEIDDAQVLEVAWVFIPSHRSPISRRSILPRKGLQFQPMS